MGWRSQQAYLNLAIDGIDDTVGTSDDDFVGDDARNRIARLRVEGKQRIDGEFQCLVQAGKVPLVVVSFTILRYVLGQQEVKQFEQF